MWFALNNNAISTRSPRFDVKIRLLVPMLAVLGVAAGSALAGTTVVDSQSAFQAATTGDFTGDFSSVGPLTNPGMNVGTFYQGYNTLSGFDSLNEVAFTTTNPDGSGNFPGYVNVNSANFYTTNTFTDLGVPYLVNAVYTGTGLDNLTITLQGAQTAFGLDFTTLFNSTSATFGLSNGFSATVSKTNTTADGVQFIGFVSTTPFTTITLDVPSQQSYVVQDFTGGTSVAVPGPIAGAGLPVLIGLVGLVIWRRRRRWQAA